MVGTAMLIDPIITEWVRHPRMSDRLMAHLAEDDTGLGALRVGVSGVVVDGVAEVRNTLATGSASLFLSRMKRDTVELPVNDLECWVTMSQYSTERIRRHAVAIRHRTGGKQQVY